MSSEFDSYSANYAAGVEHPLKRAIGSNPVDYLYPKVRALQRLAKSHFAARGISGLRVLDYGCGTGEFLDLIKSTFPEVTASGCDISRGMLDEGRRRWPHLDLQQVIPPARLPGDYDLITVVCVYHHIPPAEWAETTSRLLAALRPGGLLVVIEHNPLNPLTRYVVKRTKIDENAVLLSHRRLVGLMQDLQASIVSRGFLMFVPPKWPLAAFVDRCLNWLPLGAQYYIAATPHVTLPLAN